MKIEWSAVSKAAGDRSRRHNRLTSFHGKTEDIEREFPDDFLRRRVQPVGGLEARQKVVMGEEMKMKLEFLKKLGEDAQI